MAFNFDSEQFNKETTPVRLGNWGVPRWSPTKPRELEYRPDPKPVCDINGHFFPGAPRGHSKCFGHYVGTWDLPPKISRKVANELAKEPPPGRFEDWLHPRVQRPKAAAAAAAAARHRAKTRGKPPKIVAPVPDEKDFKEQDKNNDKSAGEIENGEDNTDKQQEGKVNPEENHDKKGDDNADKQQTEKVNPEANRYKESIDEDDPLDLYKKKEPVDADGHGPYIPGSLTKPDQRHENYDLLVKDAVEKLHGPQEDETDKFWRKVAENAKNNEERRQDMKEQDSNKNQTTKLPHVDVSRNFQFAKKMHVGNLEHQPLPDTLGYRHMTTIGEHRDSDIIVKPYAIAMKAHGAKGPTYCTKLRVHRPKTCDSKKIDAENMRNDEAKRPSTSAPDIKGHYKKPMSLMDLAICWDFRADDPKKETRPPKHIDGSNGSMAPAVFTMIKTPKEDDVENSMHPHTNPIFVKNRDVVDDVVGKHPVPYFEKDLSKQKRKDSCDVQYCPQHSNENKTASENKSKSSSKSDSEHSVKPQCDGVNGCGTPSGSRKSSHDSFRPDKLEPIKEAWGGSSNGKNKTNSDVVKRNSLDSYEKTSLAQGKLHQSSPSESQTSKRLSKDESVNNNAKHKSCISCNGTKMPQHAKQKEDYKSAFKAGNPNSVHSSNTSHDSKGLKVPKMRHPYTKKSYTIPTLAPPFSIWRDANAAGYPEHWRLASVYQHAYKPPDQRRKSLINCVYQ